IMSYSDELIHSNGTTLIFPRYPDTLPYVYTRGHSTPRFSTLPPPLSSYPTSRRIARVSVIPVIEPELAKRARIGAFNLDDYQDDPEHAQRGNALITVTTLLDSGLDESFLWCLLLQDSEERQALTVFKEHIREVYKYQVRFLVEQSGDLWLLEVSAKIQGTKDVCVCFLNAMEVPRLHVLHYRLPLSMKSQPLSQGIVF
ncbi:hypothetical protein Tco_0084120, partial [Tanacetum coccineum]